MLKKPVIEGLMTARSARAFLIFAGAILGTIITAPSAQAITPPISTITASDYTTCAIDENSTLRCWGESAIADNIPDIGKVTQVSLSDGKWKAHACAIDVQSKLWCWGTNFSGETNVPQDLGPVLQVDAGGWQTCAILINHQVRCWGSNSDGQINVPNNLGEVKQISVGQWNVCIITMTGDGRCWGRNYNGQLNIPSDFRNLVQISVGSEHACAINVSGQLRCWGVWYSYGQASIPSDGTEYQQVSSGSWNTCALTIQGTIRCWGYTANNLNVPPPNLRGLRQMVTSWNHSCAENESGQLICWGDNSGGQSLVPNYLAKIKNPEGTSIQAVEMPGTGHYYFVNQDLLSWDAARYQAGAYQFKGARGYLATITSAAENSFIASILSSTPGNDPSIHAWFGGTTSNWPNFKFADGPESGQPFTYTNWAQGEPNNYANSNEIYSVIKPNSTWNDYCKCNGLWSIVEFSGVENATQPTIQGDGRVDSTLTALAGDWESGTTFSYQWLRNDDAIPGASNSTYQVSAQDYLSNISVRVSGSKPGRIPVSMTSAAVTIRQGEALSAPSSLSLLFPALYVGIRVDLNVSPSPQGGILRVQWLRDSVPIPGANSDSYVLTNADVLRRITARAYYEKYGYMDSQPKSIDLTAISPSDQITSLIIRGNLKVDNKISVKPNKFASKFDYTYQWYRNGVAIASSTDSVYQVTAADVGKNLGVKVCLVAKGLIADCIQQTIDQEIQRGTLKVASFVISGNPKVNRLFTAKITVRAPDIQATYQWLRDGQEIVGATAKTYLIQQSDLGSQISCRVIVSKPGYETQVKESGPKRIG